MQREADADERKHPKQVDEAPARRMMMMMTRTPLA